MMKSFGRTPDGREARLYTLQSASGFRADISDYGGTVVRLVAPDRQRQFADVVLGFDNVRDYVERSPYFGCIVGRYANRIANGRFTLDGKMYTLATNNSPGGVPCHLHGGLRGFDKIIWRSERFETPAGPALRLQYRSVDGEEGYPGNLDVSVTYTVLHEDALRIDYTAVTDRPTPVNLTNHTYFNLAGEGSGDVLAHVLTLNARQYTPIKRGLVPWGHATAVTETPLDFTAPHTIGERIDVPHEQLRSAGGYDHNFIIERADPAALAVAATVLEPKSGRVLEVQTTEPGVQFYSGNFLDGTIAGKHGHVYERRHGFCLETQHFPDSPNQASFPSTILRPGETLHSTTVFRFTAR